MVKEEDTTHIRISRKLKKHIENKGEWGESHDDILRRLLKFK